MTGGPRVAAGGRGIGRVLSVHAVAPSTSAATRTTGNGHPETLVEIAHAPRSVMAEIR
jgi:hypothetical protein